LRDLSGEYKKDIERLLNTQSHPLTEFIFDEINDKSKESIREICDEVFPRLTETLLIENQENELKFIMPYGQHDILDLQMWRFAALVDIDDIFSPSNKNFIKKGKSCLADLMSTSKKIESFGNYGFFGWYMRTAFYDGLGKFYERRTIESLIEIWGDRLSISDEPKAWKEFFAEIFNNQAVRDSIIMSTRAVISALTVARDVYKDKKNKNFLNYFKDLETDIFKTVHFAQFILTEFSKLQKSTELGNVEIDRMLQIIGIFGFAIPSDYFAEYFSTDNSIYVENEQIINDIIRLLNKKEINDALTNPESDFLNQVTYFVATDDWPELFDGKPEKAKDLDWEKLKEMSKEGKAVPYSLGLPNIVKSLANLSLYGWMKENTPQWLEKTDKIAGNLANKMVEVHVGTTEDGNRCIKLGEDEDLSVTAGFVDALTLWTGALLLKASKDGEIIADCADPSEPNDDFEVFKDFMAVLKRHTQPQLGSMPKQVSDIETPEWFNVFLKLIVDCYPYGDDYWGKEPKDRTILKSPSFDDFIKLNSLIHFMAREYGKNIDDVLQKAKDFIKVYRNQEGSFGTKLVDIERELKKIFVD